MNLFRFGLLVFIFVFAGTASAQDVQPSPTATLTASPTSLPPTLRPSPTPVITREGFAVEGRVEVLFPEGVRFQVTLDRPLSEIASVSLELQQAGHLDLLLELEPEQVALFVQPQAVLVYLWEFSDDASPRLFEPLNFVWSITASDGATAQYSSSVIVRDSRAQWSIASDPGGRIIIAAPSGGRVLLEEMLPPLDRLQQEGLDVQVARWLLYVAPLYPECALDDESRPFTQAEFSAVRLPCEPGSFEALAEASGYRLVAAVSFAEARDNVLRELVLGAYAALWSGQEVPAWFSEGLVRFYDVQPRGTLLAPAQAAARTGNALSMSAMESQPDAAQRSLWNAQSYAMVAYMADQLGFDGLLDFAHSIREQSFAEAFEAAMGTPVSALTLAWQRWILTARASNQYALTLYSPATPTPSPQPTATLTRTPSPTVTPTPTITASPTGVLSPTPFDTATPTATYTMAPPTVTPRPASAGQATPASGTTPPNSGTVNRDVQTGLFVGLLAVIVVLIIAFVRAGRK